MSTIILTRSGRVATITFNRPDKMNVLSREMANQLEVAIQEVKQDPLIRVVVLRGAGEVFMAGSDLHEVYENLDIIGVEITAIVRHFNASILALREMEKPVLACVHGLVTGTGMSLMLAADLVVASDNTQFSLGFSRVATSPVGNISYSLPHLVGNKKALELLLFSENFDANTAEAWGLINWVVPHDALDSKTQQIVERLVHGPTLAIARTKHLINSAWHNKVPVQLELEVDSFVKSVNSKDFKLAVQAFINKRQPDFEGR